GARRLWNARSPQTAPQIPRFLTPAKVQHALAETEASLERLWAESESESLLSPYNLQLRGIENSLKRQTLDLQIVGSRGVGKTALRQRLMAQPAAEFRQKWAIAPLDEPEIDLSDLSVQEWPASIAQADVVLFTVQGDLTQSEWLALQHLHSQRKRILLLLNKQDQSLPSHIDLVMAQLKQRVQDTIDAADVLAIAANPQPIKVRRHQPDDTYRDTWETPEPQLHPLLTRLQHLATQEISQLVLQRAYQQTLNLQQAIQTDLNRIRRDRAMPLIERYQWIAAGTAFANPLPSLDMVATAAITGKLVQELADVYRMNLSFNRAVEIAEVFVATLLRMGIVEASSQLLSTLLKGSAATFAVGGVLQGISAAYFTRIAGLSLIELFETQMVSPTQTGSADNHYIESIIKRIFQQHQKIEIAKALVQQTLTRLPLANSQIRMA
ncbi:MAG: DUF697 domain-containing protein, partial [Thermosynechococcaceae cyanobacterium]